MYVWCAGVMKGSGGSARGGGRGHMRGEGCLQCCMVGPEFCWNELIPSRVVCVDRAFEKAVDTTIHAVCASYDMSYSYHVATAVGTRGGLDAHLLAFKVEKTADQSMINGVRSELWMTLVWLP